MTNVNYAKYMPTVIEEDSQRAGQRCFVIESPLINNAYSYTDILYIDDSATEQQLQYRLAAAQERIYKKTVDAIKKAG
jgi:hypothetical protein